MEALVDKAKSVMEALARHNRAESVQGIAEMANIVQETMHDTIIWSSERLNKFNGFMKYLLLAIENGDLDFGANVIRYGLLPLIIQVAVAEEKGQDQGHLIEKIDTVTNDIKEQYTDFMYPNQWKGQVPPSLKEDIANPDKTVAMAIYNLKFIQHVGFNKLIPTANLEILVAGCGTGESAVTCALFYPEANFTFVDISPSSLRLTRQYTHELSLRNVIILQDDIMTMDLGKQFDIIISTGVIHHLSEPSKGVSNLNKHLKDHGVLSAMVYGEFGRFEVGLFQEALKLILGNRMDFSRGIEIANSFLNEIDRSNRMVNLVYSQDLIKGNQHIVDLLLNVNEYRYNVSSLVDMLDAGGMMIVDFPNRYTMEPANYVKSPETKKEFDNLSQIDRWKVAEYINGRIAKHHFYAIKKENSYSRPIADKQLMDYVLYKSPYLLEKTIFENSGRNDFINFNYSAMEESFSGPDMKISSVIKKILDLCNGKTTLRQICSKLKGQADTTVVVEYVQEMVTRRVIYAHQR